MRARVKVAAPKLMPRPKRGPMPPLPDGQKRGPGPLVEVMLSVVHSINGQCFGPGLVRVRERQSRQLLESETRIEEQRQRALNPFASILQLGYGPTRIIRVPLDRFDDAMEHYQSTF